MIREAVLSDFEAIAALEKQVHGMHFKARPDIFLEEPYGGNIDKLRDNFEWCINDERVTIFVYEEDGRILGYCQTEAWDYGEEHSIYRDVIVLGINSMCVDEQARGRQIGRRLFERAKEYAKKIGAARIELTVSEFNEGARTFYEHLGLSVTTRCMALNINSTE